MLNKAKRKQGWLVNNFSRERKFFILENAYRIEGCRQLICEWEANRWLSKKEKAVLLASLIESLDKVANTAGTYYAYLKSWHRKSLKPFIFKFMSVAKGTQQCHSVLGEAKDLISQRYYDILYLDPPYNERNYSSYYHLPETIANLENPIVFGDAGISKKERPSSNFNRPGKVLEAFENLISSANSNLIAFHYSDNGLIPRIKIKKLLSSFGKIEEFSLKAKGYTTKKINRAVHHRLYLVSNA